MLGALRKFMGLQPAGVPDTTSAQRLRQEGNAHLGEGRLADAVRCYARAVELDPGDAAAHLNLGYARLEQGLHAQALEGLAKAAELDPGMADAPYLMGRACRESGRLPEAIAHWEKALSIDPAMPPAKAELAAVHVETARALHAAQQLDEALRACDRALAFSPGDPAALHGRAVILIDQRRFAQALDCIEQAMAAGAPPDGRAAAAFLQTHAIALDALARHEEAVASARAAVEADPADPECRRLLATALQSLGRYDEALAVYGEAIALHPGHAHLRWDESLCRLLTGDFERGWVHHEWRMRTPMYAQIDSATGSTAPRWDGQSAIDGRCLLLHVEQGLGDAIQFARYVPMVLRQGANVVLQVPRPLVDLMTGLVRPAAGPGCGMMTVIGQGEAVPPHDLRGSLLSLPAAFGTRLDGIPADVPYVVADAALRESWRARLARDDEPSRPRRLRAGLVWSGNPRHHNDHNRSIPLAQLAGALPREIDWIGLQPSVSEADRRAMAQVPQLRDLGAELRDFADTAALVENLDLVVSVDTSVAHLAGALGRPLWLLLPYHPDWRWLLDRDDSPWYPGCRLFRQGVPGDWAGVLDRLRQALAERAAGR